MFTLSVEWRMGWERSLTTKLPNQEKPLRPPPTLIETHLFKELRAMKATSLHRKVTKPLKSWEKQQEEKSRGWRGGGRSGSPKPCNWGRQGTPTATLDLRDLPPHAHKGTPVGA